MKKFFVIAVVAALLCGTAAAQWNSDILGMHDLSPNGLSPVKGGSSAACQYCHAPHSGVGNNTPLWTQQLSIKSYANLTYSSTTMKNATTLPTPGGPTNLCLSCHDGSVAVGQTVVSGPLDMSGSMNATDKFDAGLKSSHPVSVVTPLQDSPVLVSTLASTGETADPLHKVALIKGTVECTSCHEPHQQNLDQVSLKFLVRDASNGAICLSCHDPNARTVNGKSNPLAQWSASGHATSGITVAASAQLGAYTTVAQFACLTCHKPHTANLASGLMRGASPAQPAMDPATQPCYTCHSGANLQTNQPNVYAEFAKIGHPFPAAGNSHDANEPAVLTDNRHGTCADCHNGHSSYPTTTFNDAPGIRPSQTGVAGVSATDGYTPLAASNQYENCLRCHSTKSTGMQTLAIFGYAPSRLVQPTVALDVWAQMSPQKSHPVLNAGSSPLLQPSLRLNMLNLDGNPNMVRSLGTGAGSRIFCTDCHNSDDNREFGGPGPNGPHGSQFGHILERRYEYSQVTPGTNFPLDGPGSVIPDQYLFKSPSLNSTNTNGGPYALCGKCHDLSNILADNSFKPRFNGAAWRGGHSTHIDEQGISCSVCHTGHGTPALNANVNGDRLVNFDANVVGANPTEPIAYNQASNTCSLACHGYYHYANGTVAAIPIPPMQQIKIQK